MSTLIPSFQKDISLIWEKKVEADSQLRAIPRILSKKKRKAFDRSSGIYILYQRKREVHKKPPPDLCVNAASTKQAIEKKKGRDKRTTKGPKKTPPPLTSPTQVEWVMTTGGCRRVEEGIFFNRSILYSGSAISRERNTLMQPTQKNPKQFFFFFFYVSQKKKITFKWTYCLDWLRLIF